jgi:DNA-binding CsgD family transcriptional regulator
VKNTRKLVDSAVMELAEATDLVSAARGLLDIGRAIGLTSPAVIDDYSVDRLLTAADGRAMASVLGWEPQFQQTWLDEKLYLVSPIAAVCRMSTRPFAWEAVAVARAVRTAHPRRRVSWHLTPEHGIYGGITVPIHLPRGRTGSVGWFARSADVDIHAALHQHGGALRAAANLVMDLVYAQRGDPVRGCEPSPLLNERELECLSWAGLGRTDVEIGRTIHRSPATARFHIDNAIAKLGARNRTQAVAMAVRLGLIHPFEEAKISAQNSQIR